ncbi:hypothetical protein E6O75_ATG09421 [Venturia nashicola]|uniref:Uncharacterized protein n=1 Tax=Venturia nashicola TaxID=86259 RepID=A0A4Z1NKJ7_9PEZI|nr:hypothetical protein E6O75_ATG09421 [Venturia nashicola]
MSSIRQPGPRPVRQNSNPNSSAFAQNISQLSSESSMSRFLQDEPTTSARLSLGGSSDYHTLKSPKSRLLDDIDLLFSPAGDFDCSQAQSSIESFNRDIDNVLLMEKSVFERTQLAERRKMKTI